MNRSMVLATAGVALATVAVTSDAAPRAPRKPITKTYTATAPAPDPTNWVEANYSVCNQMVPNSFHKEPFKAPEAGSLQLEMSGYQGDWDLLVLNSKNSEAGHAGSSDLGVPEKTTIKIKKAESFTIVACNWAGGPTATVKYTFTYAKP
jgi:hypothetical protein